MSCLHILEIKPLSVTSFANIFYQSVGCLFLLLICHLYFFFDEVSVKVFGPFLNQVVCILIVEFSVFFVPFT